MFLTSNRKAVLISISKIFGTGRIWSFKLKGFKFIGSKLLCFEITKSYSIGQWALVGVFIVFREVLI